MILDLITLVLFLFSVSLTLTVAVLYVAWGSPERDGLGVWGLGLLAHTLSYPAFLLRLAGWPLSSVLLSNVLSVGTLALQALALARFQEGRAPPLLRRLLWAPVLVAALVALLLQHHHQLRTLSHGVLILLQSLLLLVMVCHRRPPGAMARGRQLLAIGLVLLVLAVGMRLVVIAMSGDWENPLMVSVAAQNLTYLAVLGVAVLNTMGFVLMQKERALDLQREEATHDALTGAANRRALNEALERGLSRATRSGQPVALLMVDIDWFKTVNDSFGHQVGDGVLRGLVLRLQARLRQYDLLARFGGEEFVVLLPDTDSAGARALAEDLRREVAATPFRVDGLVIPITVSLGVGALQPTGAPAEADRLLGEADDALYLAKQNGRNRVEVAAPVLAAAPAEPALGGADA